MAKIRANSKTTSKFAVNPDGTIIPMKPNFTTRTNPLFYSNPIEAIRIVARSHLHSVASILLLLPCPHEVDAESTLGGKSRVQFATADQGQEVLRTCDTFVNSMTPMDRQLRLRSARPIDRPTFRAFIERQAITFTTVDITKVTTIFDELSPQLSRLEGHWPDPLTLVKTTGEEESYAPHCRGKNAIILPTRSLANIESLRRVLVHELFHILSRQSDTQRSELYATVGFRSCKPIALPDDLRNRKITNPDAPRIDCVLEVSDHQMKFHVAPILLSRKATYDSLENSSLFNELDFRLLPVRERGGVWTVADTDPNRRLYTPEELSDFHQQIGRNTNYIIHPEEILADNFVHLILDTPELPDPWVVERLSAVLGW